MVNRRKFIQSSVAGAVLGGAGFAPQVFAADDARTRIPLYKAIYDERFPDSVAFALAARTLGVQTSAFQGDITGLWFNDLDARWREDQAVVAGLTTEAALFCLEHLARDHRMRVVYRGEHEFLSSGQVEHSFQRPDVALAYAQMLGRGDPANWAAPLARLVTGFSSLPGMRHLDSTPPAPARPDDQLLVSWVIAPAYGPAIPT
jgi:hypothetical protein